MTKTIKNNRGITLVALTITVIVLLILIGVGIGTMSGVKRNIKDSKKAIAKSDLTKIQQVVAENYIKYKQTGNERILKGIPMAYSDAQDIARNDFGVSLRSSQSYELPATSEGKDIQGNPIYYYKLQGWHLKEMGIENLDVDEYMVNYSTGEVFDITNKKTADGEILYIYANEVLGGDYIKSGLLLYLDGIDNTRNGHDGESTIWEDLSGNRNDGTLANFNNTSTSGWASNCINFDSIDDMISVPESSTTNPVAQTIEVVLKCNGDSSNSVDGRQIFFVKWYGYTMELNSDKTISYGRKNGYLVTKSSINYSRIYNITAENDGNKSKIYINNTYNNEQDAVPVAYSDMNLITIGSYNKSRYFNGSIYAIRMYNRALTDEEIDHNYQIDKARFGIED